MHLKANQAAEE